MFVKDPEKITPLIMQSLNLKHSVVLKPKIISTPCSIDNTSDKWKYNHHNSSPLPLSSHPQPVGRNKANMFINLLHMSPFCFNKSNITELICVVFLRLRVN